MSPVMRDNGLRAAIGLFAAVTLLAAWQGCESYQPVSPPVGSPAPSPAARPPATPPTQPATAPRHPPLTPVATIRSEPIVRVRIAANESVVRLSGAGALQIAPPGGQAVTLSPPITVTRQGQAFVLRPAQGQALQWTVDELRVTSPAGGAIGVGAATYPGSINLHDARDEDGRRLAGIDAVNHVAIETYLPGVLEHELYASWEHEAYRAQAIAARSYAIDRTTRNRERVFDLESNTRSQMYGGSATRPKAIEAVRATYGQVLAWEGNVVPGYYSSDTGGLGQDASIAFAGERAIPPLAAYDHGGWSQQGGSTKFRWGPVTRDRADLTRRIAAWGAAQRQRDPVANLRQIAHITVSARNRLGRPAQFTITDTSGQRYVMGPEQFRFACNFSTAQLPKLPAAQQLYSSCVEVNVTGDRVVITGGRGYGHGVGMCQWGAQGMAKLGHRHHQILATYYPGAAIVKAY
jgi:stage II sporulation protein D